MEINTIQKFASKCTGCSLCQTVCEFEAISMVEDKRGFNYPAIDEKKCIGCSACYNQCILNEEKGKNGFEPKLYAAFSYDSAVRLESTSGGCFSEIARSFILSQKGVVIGAAYTEDFKVYHTLIKTVGEIEKIRQSKYVQSSMNDVYRIISSLDEDVPVLFAGTPCQVASFKKMMENRKNELFLVDFVCRGVNSPKAFRAYLDDIERKQGKKISRVWFKNKEDGWNKFRTKIIFEDGDSISADRVNDPFMRGFLKGNLYIRDSCFDCSFKGLERDSDLTLADFWGVRLNENEESIENGVSAVIVNTITGQNMIERLRNQIYLEEKNLSDFEQGNLCLYQSVEHRWDAEVFFERLEREPFSDIILSMEEEENGK